MVCNLAIIDIFCFLQVGRIFFLDHLFDISTNFFVILLEGVEIKEAETSPPSRYNSGSMILAMENAGKLIEEEELREQIKGAGIGTSATRAEIMKKLAAG